MKSEIMLPPYVLALFDGEGDGGDGGAGAGDAGEGDQGGNQAGAGDSGAGDGGQGDGGGSSEGSRTQARTTTRTQQRNNDGRFASDLESANRRIGELNAENTNRRRENNDLKKGYSVLEQRAIRLDAEKILSTAGAVSERVVDLFLEDNREHIKIDGKTGKTLGLDLERIESWKKANAPFFKAAAEGDGQGDGAGDGSGSGDGQGDKDGKGDKDGQRRNSTAASGSKGNGSGGDDKNTGGLPDLRGLSAPDRAKAIREYTQGLKGAGGGYGRATSRQRSA